MITYGKQTIELDDIEAIVEVLNGDWLTQGPKVKDFETVLKSYFGAKYSCVVSNGTAALHLASLALDWKPGDIIITSPITFLASANCIVYAGATPDFVDIDLSTYNIDINKLEERIIYYLNNGKKVKAVIGIDYAGHPCDWSELRYLADKYNFQLVNDNCHSLGAKYFNNRDYGLKYADIMTQSYHPVKHITTGEGGSVLTNEKDIDEKIRMLRSHGMTKNPKILSKNDGPWYYEMHDIGYNYRITDLQCAMGISQLSKLDSFIEKRRKIAKLYNYEFGESDFLKSPVENKNSKHAFHLYPLLIDFKKIKKKKKSFFNHMKSKNILLQVHYIPVHLQPFYQKNYGFKKGDFSNAEEFYKNEVSLPIYPRLLEEDQELVIGLIKKYFYE